MLFEDNLLCFGQAVVLDIESLLRGSSKKCASYGTGKPLSERSDFVISAVEVWKFIQ